MAFREVRVFEVREVLRLFLRGEGVRSTERLVGVDRKTVRRYLAAAGELGLVVEGGEEQLTDEFVALVVDKVRPCRRDGRGEAWAVLVANHAADRRLVEDRRVDGGQGARVARPARDRGAAADVAPLRAGGVRRRPRPARLDGARR